MSALDGAIDSHNFDICYRTAEVIKPIKSKIKILVGIQYTRYISINMSQGKCQFNPQLSFYSIKFKISLIKCAN